MKIWHLFFVSSMPVVQMLLVSAVGSFLATSSVNLLGPDIRKKANDIVFYVLMPSLVSTNMAKSVSVDSIAKLWFMPLNVLFTFFLGALFGLIVIQITRPPSQLRGLVVGCCAAGNLGNFIFIIIPAVCKQKGNPFGDPDVCHTNALTYASLSMALSFIYQWSIVYNIVRFYSDKNSDEVEGNISINSPEHFIEEPHVLSDNMEEDVKVGFSVNLKQRFKILDEKMNLRKWFPPPTIAAVVGFVVGAIPPVRKALIGESAPLHVIQDSASLLGDGAIPVLTLVLGGNLLKGLAGPKIKKSLIVGIIIARYILLPISGVFIVKGAIHFGLLHANPFYEYVLLLQYALPPAINIGTMVMLFGTGEGECSVIMMWTYIIALVTVTLWSTLFMWLVS